MDQSLRTVATQLLNVSGPDAMVGVKDEKIQSKLSLLIRKPDRIIPPSRETVNDNQKNSMEPVKELNVDSNKMEMVVGRPVNSKYSFFEHSHPGQAMAITEEELEKELSATRHPTGQNKPTTTGGLSTWILLNPPSTTIKSSATDNKKKIEEITTKVPISSVSSVKFNTTVKADLKTTASLPKTSTVNSKTTISTVSMDTTVTTPRSESRSTSPRSSSTLRTTKIDDENTTTSKTTTKKNVSTNKNTLKPRSTTPRSTTVVSKITTMKIIRPTRPSKPAIIRKSTTATPEMKVAVNSTSRIEKVTFKPVQMITTPKPTIESVPKPTFITKIQASFQTDEKSTSASIESVVENEKSNVSSSQSVTGKKKASKPTTVLKVNLKKPIDTHTTIEIQPIKVNAPVLTIERVEDPKEKEKDTKNNIADSINLENTKVDVKFDFNPELTKIETITEPTTTTTTTTTTTKRPKTSSKRKKHKTRRRKPSVTTVSSSTSSTTIINELLDDATASIAPETSLQESKIVPESKLPSNKTNKKKQVAKPIGTQIYNFLSREVMPSVGVMSLVGLGLGLASYFLYPFGGAIARRNYEVEPNYKYNPDEYGGNYGQREEEVFSKVLQGMNTNDGKYGGMKEFEKNHYRYQVYDGAYGDIHSTRKTDPRYPSSSVPIYRPENTPLPYDLKYRNTEFKYPDSPSTPNYYERQKISDFSQNNADRQFVVGNIPKEYSNDEIQIPIISTTTENIQTDFEKQIAQNLQFTQNSVNLGLNYQQSDAQALKSENYDEIEITPTAVAVEHGPRSLKLKKLENENSEEIKKRLKRESVIQFIPSRSEIEKEENEEPLSNEILDIIDSALPENMINHKTKYDIEKKDDLTTVKPREELTTTATNTISKTKETEVEENSTKSLPTTSALPTLPSIDTESSSHGIEPESETIPTNIHKPEDESSSGVFNFLKRIAEIKFRLGLTILKHASESFARYLGHVQKRINGEE